MVFSILYTPLPYPIHCQLRQHMPLIHKIAVSRCSCCWMPRLLTGEGAACLAECWLLVILFRYSTSTTESIRMTSASTWACVARWCIFLLVLASRSFYFSLYIFSSIFFNNSSPAFSTCPSVWIAISTGLSLDDRVALCTFFFLKHCNKSVLDSPAVLQAHGTLSWFLALPPPLSVPIHVYVSPLIAWFFLLANKTNPCESLFLPASLSPSPCPIHKGHLLEDYLIKKFPSPIYAAALS